MSTSHFQGYDGPISSASTLRSHAFGGSVYSLDSVGSKDPFGKSPRGTRKVLEKDEPTATGPSKKSQICVILLFCVILCNLIFAACF